MISTTSLGPTPIPQPSCGASGSFAPSANAEDPLFTGTEPGTGYVKCTFTCEGAAYSDSVSLTVREVKIVSHADWPYDYGGTTTYVPAELTAEVEPDGINGTCAWSETKWEFTKL